MTQNNFTKDFFNSVFKNHKEMQYCFDYKKMGIRDRRIIEILNKFGVKGKKCLDIGPGTGRWLQYLKSNSAAYLGAIDISEISIQRYQVFCNKTQKADVEYEEFGFESDFFEIVLSFMLLEHLKDPQKFISELVRVTKFNGIIIMSIPNILSLISRLRMLFGFLPSAITSDKTHVKFYSKKELVKLFKPYNLAPIIVPTSFSVHPFKSKKLRIPSNYLTWSFDDHLLFYIIKKTI